MLRTAYVNRYLNNQHIPQAYSSVSVFCYARLQQSTRGQELSHLLRGAFQGLVLFPFLPLEKTVTS